MNESSLPAGVEGPSDPLLVRPVRPASPGGPGWAPARAARRASWKVREDLAPGIFQEVRRWSDRLRVLIHERRATLASIERALGLGNGYLRQVLRPGSPALKVEQAFAILEVLNVPREEFLWGLYLGALDEADQAPPELLRLIDRRARAAAEEVFARRAKG